MNKSIKSKKKFKLVPESDMDSQILTQFAEKSEKSSFGADGNAKGSHGRNRKPLKVSKPDAKKHLQPIPEDKIESQIQLSDENEKISLVADDYGRGNRGRKRKDMTVSEPEENKDSQLVSKSEMDNQVEAQFANENEIISEAAGNHRRKRKALTVSKPDPKKHSQLDPDTEIENQVHAQLAKETDDIAIVADVCTGGNRGRKRKDLPASKTNEMRSSQLDLESGFERQIQAQGAKDLEKIPGVPDDGRGKHGRKEKILTVSKPVAKEYLLLVPESEMDIHFPAQHAEEVEKTSIVANIFGRGKRNGRRKLPTVSKSDLVEPSQLKSESEMESHIQPQLAIEIKNSIVADDCGRGSRGRKRTACVSKPDEKKHLKLVSETKMESQLEAQLTKENEKISLVPDECIDRGNRGRKKKALAMSKLDDKNHPRLVLENETESKIQAHLAEEIQRDSVLANDFGRGNSSRKKKASTVSKPAAKEQSILVPESEMESHIQAQLAGEIEKKSIVTDDFSRASRTGRRKPPTVSKSDSVEYSQLKFESRVEDKIQAQLAKEIKKNVMVADHCGNRGKRKKALTAPKPDEKNDGQLVFESEIESIIQTQPANESQRDSTVVHDFGRANRSKKGKILTIYMPDAEGHLQLVPEDETRSKIQCAVLGNFSIVEEDYGKGRRGRKKIAVTLSKRNAKENNHNTFDAFPKHSPLLERAQESNVPDLMHAPQGNNETGASCSPDNKPEETSKHGRKGKVLTISKPDAEGHLQLVPEDQTRSKIQFAEVGKFSIVEDNYGKGRRGRKKIAVTLTKRNAKEDNPKHSPFLERAQESNVPDLLHDPQGNNETGASCSPDNKPEETCENFEQVPDSTKHGRKGKVLTISKPNAEGHLQLVPEDKTQSKIQCAEVGNFSIVEDDYGKGRRGRKKNAVALSKRNAKENNHNTSDAFPKHCPFLKRAQESNVPDLMHDPQGNNVTGASCSPDNKPEETCENIEEVPNSTKHSRKGKVLTISKPDAEGHLQLVPEDETQSKIQCAEVGKFSIVEDDYGKGRRGRKKIAMTLSKRNVKENNHNTSDAFPKHSPFLERAQESNVPDLMHDPQGNNETGASCSPDNKPEETCENIEQVPDSTELKASEHQNRKSRKRPAFYLTSDLKKHQRARKIPFDSLPVGFGLGITGWPSSREIVAEHLSPLPLQVDEKVNDNCVEPIENDQESTRGKGKDSSAVQSVVKSSHADCKVHPSEAVQTSENQLTLSTGLMNKSIEQCGKASLRNLISSNGIATEKSRRKKQPLPASHLTLRTSRHKKDSRK